MPSITEPIQLSFDTPRLCECGCGQPAPIAKWTSKSKGHVKGQPVRFINGHHPRLAPIEERFWARVDKTTTPDGCWPWTGARDSNGYGNLTIDGEYKKAHRVAYELAIGPVPEGHEVLHRCDNPPCCKPADLFTGTIGDNMQDKAQKGRAPRGESHPNAELTEEDVREMRRLREEGWSLNQLADRYGRDKANISLIVRGLSWKHIK